MSVSGLASVDTYRSPTVADDVLILSERNAGDSLGVGVRNEREIMCLLETKGSSCKKSQPKACAMRCCS